MSYGIAIRTSSGLTDLKDIFTVRPKQEKSFNKGNSSITLSNNQDVSYGNFTNLGVNYDSTTDAFFVTKYGLVWKTNQVKTNFWLMASYTGLVDINLAHTLVLDDSSNEVKLTWHNKGWTFGGTLTIIPGTGEVALYVDCTIIKIKAS